MPETASGESSWVSPLGIALAAPPKWLSALAESVFECRKLDCEDVGGRYLEWWKASGFDTGPTAQRVLELVAGGHSFHTAAGMVNIELGGATRRVQSRP